MAGRARILYIFDPKRNAVLLVAGDKFHHYTRDEFLTEFYPDPADKAAIAAGWSICAPRRTPRPSTSMEPASSRSGQRSMIVTPGSSQRAKRHWSQKREPTSSDAPGPGAT